MNQKNNYFIILDDENLAVSYLSETLDEIIYKQPPYQQFKILSTTQQSIFWDLLKSYQPCIIFIDIQMPGKTGIEIAKEINNNYLSLGYTELPIIVFTTAYENYGYQAFKVEAFDYLLKPIDEELLSELLHKIFIKKPELFSQADEFIQVQSFGIDLDIPIKDILYFKADMKYISIITAVKEFLINETLLNLEKKYNNFIKIHRSYLVNPNYISRFYKKDSSWFVILKNHHEHLPISRRQKTEIQSKIDYKIVFNDDES